MMRKMPQSSDILAGAVGTGVRLRVLTSVKSELRASQRQRQ